MDGIYDSDPEKNPSAIHFEQISYQDVIRKDLQVMDMTAITLCKENHLPIAVFNMNIPSNLRRLVLGEKIGTTVNDSLAPTK